MARLFQKYVTSEGRSEIPPDDESNKVVLDGFTDGFNREKTGSSAFKLSDFVDEGQKEESSGVNMDTIMPMYVFMHGLRNLIQALKGMAI